MEALEEGLRRRGFDTLVEPVGDSIAAPIVVVDSYERRADGGWVDADLIVAIDDLDRDLAVDVLVDPSPGSTPDPHRRSSVVLAGPRFALVGPGLPDRVREPAEVVQRVLVTLGGHDPEGLAWRIGSEIVRHQPDLVVATTGGPVEDDDRAGVERTATTSGLGAALDAADLVVCAGGVTLIESLVLGRPTVAVIVAENQRRAAEAAEAAGAAVLATAASAAGEAHRLVGDPAARRKLGGRARDLVDRGGPDRIAAVVADRLAGARR